MKAVVEVGEEEVDIGEVVTLTAAILQLRRSRRQRYAFLVGIGEESTAEASPGKI